MSEIRNDVLKLISLCNFDKIPKKFWKDKEIVLTSVKKEGWALEYADEIFKKDKQIVLVAVKSNNGNPHNSGALKYAHESLRRDKDVVLEAVKYSEYALEYAHESLRKDKDVVLEAVKSFGWALRYVDPKLKKDSDVIQVTKKIRVFYELGGSIKSEEPLDIEELINYNPYT